MNDMKPKGKVITAEYFKERVGRVPINDDIERCNCPDAGKIGHFLCGWCDDCDMPKFICMCVNFPELKS